MAPKPKPSYVPGRVQLIAVSYCKEECFEATLESYRIVLRCVGSGVRSRLDGQPLRMFYVWLVVYVCASVEFCKL